jgi:hypothetical protein
VTLKKLGVVSAVLPGVPSVAFAGNTTTRTEPEPEPEPGDARDAAITSCVSEYVPGPHTEGFDDWNTNDTAYSAVAFNCVQEPNDVWTPAVDPCVPSKTTAPVNDNEGDCV